MREEILFLVMFTTLALATIACLSGLVQICEPPVPDVEEPEVPFILPDVPPVAARSDCARECFRFGLRSCDVQR